jgi:hypothetical protein
MKTAWRRERLIYGLKDRQRERRETAAHARGFALAGSRGELPDSVKYE